MNWENEAKLVETFISSIAPQGPSIIMREVDTNFGRPDVIIIEYDEKRLEKRKKDYKNTEFTKIMSYSMTYLCGKSWVKEETLFNYLSCSKAEFKRNKESLCDLKLIDTNKHYIKAKTYRDAMIIKRIWVYEAKLSKWKQAIEQAERHLWFTNDSYILLPEISDSIMNKSIEECGTRGVGLSILKEDNSIKTLLRTAKKGIVNCPIVWQLNEQLIRGKFIECV